MIKLLNRRLVVIATLLAGGTLICLMYFLNPLRYTFYPPCFFKKITGLDCPGCGSARALYALLHGHLLLALDYNVFVVAFIPVILCGLFYRCTGKGKLWWNILNKPWLYFVVICLFFILRNINIYPFTILNSGY